MTLIVEGDKRSPRITANFSTGIFEISGISLPENPYNFYQPFLNELDLYLKAPCKETVLSLKLEYFNTGSALALRNTIQKLNDNLPKDALLVKWYYETDDIDMLDSGQEFASIFKNSRFEIIEIEEF